MPISILFLNPPFKGRFSRTSRSPAVTKGGTLYYPIWLAYAAGTAGSAGYSFRLIDAAAKALSMEDVLAGLDGFNPDLVVVDTSTPSIYKDVSSAAQLKISFPDAFVVLVGTHPSALPGETLALNPAIDAVAVGEYDLTICDLADSLEKGRSIDSVDGLAYNQGGQLRHTRPREKNQELDALPFVSMVYREHLDMRDYFFAAANYPMVMIMTGRGCPHNCFFCVYPQVMHGRFYRVRSPENVVDEFEYIIRNFPKVKEIGIEDDCFTANPKRVRKICDLIVARGIKIKWYCNVRGDVDFSLLLRMKQAGCRMVTVGFESGVQRILDNINKNETVDRYKQFAMDAQKAGLLVHGCIMTGNPGDTKQTLSQSYEFAKKINCDSMQFYPLYVYPGTEAYEWAMKNDYLKTRDFAQWLDGDGNHNCVLDLPGLSSEEMVRLCGNYLKKYHLRPGYLAGKIWQAVLNPSEGYRSLKSAKALFGNIIKEKFDTKPDCTH